MYWSVPIVAAAATLILVLLIVYYVLLSASILQMLERKVNTVLLVFAFVALFPLPPTNLVAGIVILIIWHRHKRIPTAAA